MFDRYGVVVLGYSGADEGIGRVLRTRRSRFGVWWVARGELGKPAAELVEATRARVIHRESAAEFLDDLERRLAVFEEHPSGITPTVAHDGMLAMIRARDDVGIAETLRRERYEYETGLQVVVADASARGAPTADSVREAWSNLQPVLERRAAALLPIALYDKTRFASEIGRIARALEGRPRAGGYAVWLELPEWAATWLGYLCGALLVRLDRFDALTPLLETTWNDANNLVQPVIWLPGEASQALGRRWSSPRAVSSGSPLGGSFLTRMSVSDMDWLQERYPELVGENEPRGSMAQFDVLLCIRYALMDHRAAAFFELGGDAPTTLALRLHRDARLRDQLAAALGLSLEQFDEKAPDALRAATGIQGGFLSHGTVANALENGSAS